jgi:hypothetical protein
MSLSVEGRAVALFGQRNKAQGARARSATRHNEGNAPKMEAMAFVYCENESGRRSSAKLLTRDEAFLIAVNIAKLPSVPRQILKDIPRPPNSASRDD